MWQVVGVEAVDGAVIVANIEEGPVTNTKDDGDVKISQVAPNLALGIAGLGGDGRHLATRGRVVAVEHWFKFGEHPSAKRMARGLAEHALSFSRSSLTSDDERYRTARPMGLEAVVAGLDGGGGAVYSISPGGNPRRWRAVAVGAGAEQAEVELEAELRRAAPPDLSPASRLPWTLDEARDAAVRVVRRVARDSGQPTDELRVVLVGRRDIQEPTTNFDSHSYDDGWSCLGAPLYQDLDPDEVRALVSRLAEVEN